MTREFDVARIAVCARSPAHARDLVGLLEHDRDLLVTGRCWTPSEALALVRREHSDLLVIDLAPPIEPGIETIAKIMRVDPLPILALSDEPARGSEMGTAALEAGALEVQRRSQLPLADIEGAHAAMFRRHVKRLSLARVAGRRRAAARQGSVRAGGRRASAIAIAASTGGPAALESIVAALPAGFAIPVLVVQHLSPGFMEGLAGQLGRIGPVPVRMARDGERLSPGVWLADDDAHLAIDGDLHARRDRSAVAGYHRPAADVLFASLAAAAGPRATSVVLTGMGADGAEGTAAVRAAGGLTIAQDEATSAIYGMPRMAADAGAELVLPLDEIGPTLARLIPVEDAS